MRTKFPFVLLAAIFLCISGVAYGVDIFHKLNFSTQAASCNITSPVTGTVTLTPTSGDNVVDCSGMDITVSSGGKLILESVKTLDTSSTNDMGVVLKVRNLTIDSGGEISADGKGYVVGQTDSVGNAGNSLGSTGGAGGGHGGAGGEGNGDGVNPSGTPGQSNGNREMPLLLGGSGGTSGNGGLGGNGGGAIKVEASGTLTVNGVVSANGTDGAKSVDSLSSGGGGAGGSVWLEAEVLEGSGLVRVNGGGTDQLAGRIGGGGGGGRLVMVCRTTNNFGGQVTALGGDGSQDGQAGSIIGPGCIPNTPSILKIFEGSGVSTRELVEGALTRNTTVSFASNLQDSNVGSTVRLQVELRQVTDSFTGVATNTQSSYVSSPKACSAPVGDCGLVTVSGLTVSKEYKVRYRAQNNLGISSSWVELGTVGNTDFIVVGNPVGITKVSGDNQTGTVGQVLGEGLVGKVVDAAGYGVPFEGLTWSVRSGGGSTAVSSGSTGVDGTISTTWTLGTTAGSNNNTVRLARMSGNSVVYSATYTASSVADVVAKYSIVAPSLSVINTNFSYEIRALDQYNNQTDYDGLLNIYPFLVDQTTPGTGTLTPSSGTMSNGYLQISNGSYNYAESIRIKVEDVNLNEGFSNSILFVATAGTCPAIDIDSNRTWRAIDAPGGIYDCRGLGTLTVRSGITFTLQSYDNGDTNYTNDYGVTILVDAMTTETGSIVFASGLGYINTRGYGSDTSNWDNAPGASYGGYGANGSRASQAPYGTVFEPSALGSGGPNANMTYGRRGGYGGGSIKLVSSGIFNNNGTIVSDGTVGVETGGGGSGGSIWIETVQMNGAGVIKANGGNGPYGGGGGGRIAIYYNSGNYPFTTIGNLQTLGGSGGGGYGGAGTIYLEDKDVDLKNEGTLIVNNGAHNGQYAGLISGNYKFKNIYIQSYGHLSVIGQASNLEVPNASVFVGDSTKPTLLINGTFTYLDNILYLRGLNLDVNGKAVGIENTIIGDTLQAGLALRASTWYYNNSSKYTFTNLQVGPSGTLTLYPYNNGDSDWTNDYNFTLQSTNLLVDTGGVITADGLGYVNAKGPGSDTGNGDNAPGASYGGYGANGSRASQNPYGDVYEPTLLGSGGPNGNMTYGRRGGYGGGAMKFVISGVLTNNGTITSSGAVGVENGGGGSGGSIWIDTPVFDGAGIVRTNGGNGPYGGGGGGRVAIYYTSGSYPVSNVANVQSLGGSGNGGYGGPGTVYVEQKGVDVNKGAKLYIDNASHNTMSAGLVEASYKFTSISLTRYGHLVVLGNNSILEVTDGSALTGDSTMPRLTVEGTIIMPETVTLNGVDLGVKGAKQGLNNLSIGVGGNVAGFTIYEKTWAHNNVNNFFTFGNVEVGVNSRFTLAYGSTVVDYGQNVGITFGSLTVRNGGIVTLPSYADSDATWTNDYGVTLNATTLTLDSGSSIVSDGLGYVNAKGPGSDTGNGDNAPGASHGGYGNVGSRGNQNPYDSVYEPSMLGSGGPNANMTYGRRGGYGGGAMKFVVSGTFTNNGTISSNGTGAVQNGGGGSGGSIWIDTGVFDGAGLVRTNGVGDGNTYGGGGGGRVAIYYTSGTYPVSNVANVQSLGGYGNSGYGGPGTVYVEQKGVDVNKGARLYVDNANHNTRSAGLVEATYKFTSISLTRYGHLTVIGNNSILEVDQSNSIQGDSTYPSIAPQGILRYTGTGSFDINGFSLDVQGKVEGITDINIGVTSAGGLILRASTWAYNKDVYPEWNNMVVGPFGLVTLYSYSNADSDWTNDYGTVIKARNLNVQSGGILTADGLGYPNAKGPGVDTAGLDGGPGGSYGGYGGNGNRSSIAPYGDIYLPEMLGSGGGNGNMTYGRRGGYGGGAIKILVTETFTHNGIITSGGTSGIENGGGGTGGSILISTSLMEGSGVIRANGGVGPYSGGSGGRIAVYYDSNTYPLTNISKIQALGGVINARNGGPGTIYFEDKALDVETKGTLRIDNNTVATRAMDFNAQIWKFREVYIGKNLTIWITGNQVDNMGVQMEVADLFTLDTGAKILGTGKGYDGGEGPGVGNNGQGQSGGGGGANGGDGGAGEGDGLYVATPGGVKYGDQLQPLVLGSGGGLSGTGTAGGNGGGAFGVVSKTGHIEILGDINMDGTNGLVGSPGGGGGAGGSILIYGDSCNITGNLSAKGGNGGDGDFDGGGGGGGRVSILYVNGPCGVSGAVAYTGGTSPNGQVGQIGTFPPEPNSVPYPAGFQNQYEIKDEAELGMGGSVMASQMMFGYRETQLSDGVVLDYKAYDLGDEVKKIFKPILNLFK